MALLSWSGPAAADPAPTAAALGVDFPAEMAAVVSARYAPALATDRSALATASATLSAADSHQAGDTALLAGADAAVASDTAEVASAGAAVTSATAARAAAGDAVTADHRRLGAIALSLYTDPDGTSGPVAGALSLSQAQSQADAEALVAVVTTGAERRSALDSATLVEARRTLAVDTDHLATATAALATVQRLRTDRAEILGADAAGVAAAGDRVGEDRAALASDTAAQAAAVAAVAEPAGAPTDGSPTIQGGAALDAATITGWYDAQGDVDLTVASIQQLAAWYLSEGAAEGVRGDIAFAQAMVETGGFASADAVDDNDYAGIGHCDSCLTGLVFPSPQMGVRGQIQLLKGFADPTLTTATLADPPVLASLTPETEPDRGCCATWQSLTGHWASDPLYGHTVMSVYQSMLGFALRRPSSG